VAVTASAGLARPLHPLQAIFLAFPVSLFVAALLSDIAYFMTFHIQWTNFASWLIAGGLLMGGIALLWAVVDLVRYRAARRKLVLPYVLVLLGMWGVGFFNALIHAKDAWATMPAGLILSVVTVLMALWAALLGYSRGRLGEVA